MEEIDFLKSKKTLYYCMVWISKLPLYAILQIKGTMNMCFRYFETHLRVREETGTLAFNEEDFKWTSKA